MTYSRGIPARDGGGNGLGTKEIVDSGGDSEEAWGLGLGGTMTAVSRKRGLSVLVRRRRRRWVGLDG